MHAHLVQFDIAWEDRRENFARVRGLLDAAPLERGDLVLLPELFDSGFSLNTGRTRDDGGETQAFVCALARERSVYVQGSRNVPGPGGKHLNLATIAGPAGEIVAEYAKVHPFSFGREGEAFEGGRGIVTYAWSTPGGAASVCPAICYDLRFPELFRLGAMRGAEVFALGANWPAPRAHHWRALLIARAIENQAYVLGVNRVGRDPHLIYAGGSIVVSPAGHVVGEMGAEEGVLSARIDLESLREWRRVFPALRDIRLMRAE